MIKIRKLTSSFLVLCFVLIGLLLTTTAFAASATTQITATHTSSKVLVNSKVIAIDAYNINGNNYFKLRDVAKVVSGSSKQFNVTWDGSKNAINLITGQAYTEVGGELANGDGTTKIAFVSSSTIFIDGKPANLIAYTINGNNYFKLRDLGQSIGFSVGWDGANNCIMITTTQNNLNAELDEKVAEQYAAILSDCVNGILPFGKSFEKSGYTDDKYAIYDIDSDGIQELILSITDTNSASMMEVVYEYNSNTETFTEQFQGYPDCTYYDNGVIEVPMSHNQGLGTTIWPYSLYQYTGNNQYQYIMSIDSWDKSAYPYGYAGDDVFPHDKDKDGNGIVIIIQDETKSYICDDDEYKMQLESILNSAAPISLNWVSFGKDFTGLRPKAATSSPDSEKARVAEYVGCNQDNLIYSDTIKIEGAKSVYEYVDDGGGAADFVILVLEDGIIGYYPDGQYLDVKDKSK